MANSRSVNFVRVSPDDISIEDSFDNSDLNARRPTVCPNNYRPTPVSQPMPFSHTMPLTEVRSVIQPRILNSERQDRSSSVITTHRPLQWVEDRYREQKNSLLNYIYPDSEPAVLCPFNIPQKELFCCCQPSERRIIFQDGSPDEICSICRKVVCEKKHVVQPRVEPKLLVTAAGPFVEPSYLEKSFTIPCCCSNPFTTQQCGSQLRNLMPCCAQPLPPRPQPPRPLQKLAPSLFFPYQPKKKTLLERVLPCTERQESEKPLKGGVVGALEDLTIIGLKLTHKFLDTSVNLINSLNQKSRIRDCQCSPPFQRYPKNGIYDEPSDPPTRTSGCELIDAFNNFMDSLSFTPSKVSKVITIKPRETLDTERTGNWIIDKTNEVLDKIIPVKEDTIIDYTKYKHRPFQALITHFREKPKAKPVKLLDINVEKTFKNMPKIVYGQSPPKLDDGPYIDYVDFHLNS